VTSWKEHNLRVKVDDQESYTFQSWSDGSIAKERRITLSNSSQTIRAKFCTAKAHRCLNGSECCSEFCSSGVCAALVMDPASKPNEDTSVQWPSSVGAVEGVAVKWPSSAGKGEDTSVQWPASAVADTIIPKTSAPSMEPVHDDQSTFSPTMTSTVLNDDRSTFSPFVTSTVFSDDQSTSSPSVTPSNSNVLKTSGQLDVASNKGNDTLTKMMALMVFVVFVSILCPLIVFKLKQKKRANDVETNDSEAACADERKGAKEQTLYGDDDYDDDDDDGFENMKNVTVMTSEHSRGDFRNHINVKLMEIGIGY